MDKTDLAGDERCKDFGVERELQKAKRIKGHGVAGSCW
jgi:hypothetical protein